MTILVLYCQKKEKKRKEKKRKEKKRKEKKRWCWAGARQADDGVEHRERVGVRDLGQHARKGQPLAPLLALVVDHAQAPQHLAALARRQRGRAGQQRHARLGRLRARPLPRAPEVSPGRGGARLRRVVRALREPSTEQADSARHWHGHITR